MSTIPAFKINGVIDTSKTVLSNLDVLCRASGCWLTYDSTTALWSVIINRAGSSTKSFTDANIIGAINITGTGIDQLYNSVEVTYPDQDLQNNQDTVNFSIPDANRLPNELDKKLSISLDCVNNQIQAAYIGIIELNQNRVDKIIQFKTDFRSLGLRSGDLIDITSPMYGYTNKVFRITKIAEDDEDDGNIQLSITALEYDAAVYEQGSLVYTAKVTATGVVPKSANTALSSLDAVSGGSRPTVSSFQTGLIEIIDPDNAFHEISLGYSLTLPYTGNYHTSYSVNWGGNGNPTITIAGTVYPWGVRKNSVLVLKTNGSTINNTALSNTGDANVQLYEDHFLDSFWSGTKGQVVDFYFQYRTDWGGDHGGNGGTDTVAGFLVTSETKFNGNN